MDESPTPPRRQRSPSPPMDVQRFWPAQTRLEHNLREDRFHQPNEYRGEWQPTPYPDRSSSLPPETSITENSSAQPDVELGTWTQWMGQIVWMSYPLPGIQPSVVINQDNRVIPAWCPVPAAPINPWMDESQFVNFHPSPEREPVRENAHERAAYEQGFQPIRRSFVIDNWKLFWRAVARKRGVYLKGFDEHPGRVVANLRQYANVLQELGFKQQHGGIRLIRTMTRFRGIIIDHSYVAEYHDADEELVQPENAPAFQPSTVYNSFQSNFLNNTQMPMPATTPQENVSTNMTPGAALITYHQHSTLATTRNDSRQVLNDDDIDPPVEIEEAEVDLFHPLPTMEMHRRAFSSISTSIRQWHASDERLDSFERWCVEGNAEREIAAIEQQTFPNHVTGGSELQSTTATGSGTSSSGATEAENQQLVAGRGRRRGGTMFHW